MKRVVKFLGFAVMALLLVGAGLALMLKAYLTPEKIRALIEKEAASVLHRQVELGAISVGLVKGLEVEDFKLSEDPDFAKGTFISSEKFVIHLRLLPLLFKKVLIRDIELVKPNVSVIRFADGETYNFSSFKSSSSSTGASPLTLLVSQAGIESGTLNFIDQSPSQQSLSINNLNLKLKNFSLTAPMQLNSSFSLKMKKANADVILAGAIDLAGNLKIETCSVANGPSKITLKGETKNLMAEQPSFDLDLTLQKIHPAFFEMFASSTLPVQWKGDLNGAVALNGTKQDISLKELNLTLGSFNLNGDGSIHNIAEDSRSFKLRMMSNDFSWTEFAQNVPMAQLPPEAKVSGTVRFSADINGTADQGLMALKIDGPSLDISYGDSFKKAAGIPLTIETAAKYSGSFVMDFSSLMLTVGQITLSGPGKFIKDPNENRYFFTFKSNNFPLEDAAAVLPSLNGYDITGRGTIPNIKIVSSPDGADATGAMTLSNVTTRYEEARFTKLAGNISFTPDSVSIPKLTGLLNGSDIKADLSIKQMETHPIIVANIEAAELDLDKLIPKEKEPKAPQKKTDAGGLFIKEAWAAPVPEKNFMDLPMNLMGSLKAGKIKHEYLTGTNLEVRWNLIDFTKDFSKMNGTVSLRQGNGQIKNAQKLASTTAIARILLLPLSLLEKIQKASKGALKLPSFDNFNYNDIIGDYSFKSGLMTISKFKMNGTDLLASMTGTVNLAGNQEINLEALATPKGLPEVSFSVGGTISNPTPSLNLAETGKSILQSKQVQDLLKGIFKK